MPDQFPIHRAAEIAGNHTELARRIGRAQSTVHRWMKRGWPAPDACADIEKLTGITIAELLAPAKRRTKPDQQAAA